MTPAESEPEKDLVYVSAFDEDDTDGWRSDSPRPEIAPRFGVERVGDPPAGQTAALFARANEVAGCQGTWKRTVTGIEGGAAYGLSVRFRSGDVASERASIYARIRWLDANRKPLKGNRHQEYFLVPGGVPRDPPGRPAGRWKTITGVRTAPEEARAAEIRLVLAWAPGGTVWWTGAELYKAGVLEPRRVRLATVHRRPKAPSTPEANVKAFCEMLDRAGRSGADICCLPEAETTVSVRDADIARIAEPIPGPVFVKYAERARRWKMYVVACFPERDGRDIYNTAVLIGRDGSLVGKYRKTHLPNEEIDAGATPGDSYPVFETDFGKVGLMICWDVSFPEVARALALKGARVILMPIWGGSDTLIGARALENAVYMVTSGYGASTGIMDPLGSWIDVVRERDKNFDPAAGRVVTADVDVNDLKRWSWVGDFSRRLYLERRPDLAEILTVDEP